MPSLPTRESELAVNGGPKAVVGLKGKSHPKVGTEEFLEWEPRDGGKSGSVYTIRRKLTSPCSQDEADMN